MIPATRKTSPHAARLRSIDQLACAGLVEGKRCVGTPKTALRSAWRKLSAPL